MLTTLELKKLTDKQLLTKFSVEFNKNQNSQFLQSFFDSQVGVNLQTENNRQILIELIGRFRAVKTKRVKSYQSSFAMGNYLVELLTNLEHEVLVVVCLDTKHRIIQEKVVFKGTLTHTTVHPREIFKLALLTQSSKIILAHNHPSGDLSPSKADIDFSKKIKRLGKLMEIECLDQFIVSNCDFLSLESYDFI